MAPLMEDSSAVKSRPTISSGPRFLVVGGGSRGNAYARALSDSGLGVVAAIAEPVEFKRKQFGRKYIWHDAEPSPGQEFADWKQYLEFERQRRQDQSSGSNTVPAVDGVFICIHDEHHVEAVTALAPLGLHVLCEKPLATTLNDCLRIQQAIKTGPMSVFAIGHVLRYSPHNMLLRDIVLERRAIGDVVSLEHTEPIGWWHYSHSYVRGYWRKESKPAPSLLTKSCHDVDFIMWMMCSPASNSKLKPHLPRTVSSTGALKQFRRQQKPKAAGDATNCLSCPIQDTCQYSAKRIYYDRHLAKGKALAEKTFWPVEIVNPEVESLVMDDRPDEAKAALFKSLAEDYDARTTSVADIESRPWFGRCVWESDNDVVDDQIVTLDWDDTEPGKGAKTAVFHMIAPTLAQCDRRGWIYGTSGEVSYDSKTITVHNFTNDETTTYKPHIPKNSHHGGGDDGIVQQFVKAIIAVKDGAEVTKAQRDFLGCDVEEVVRSHAAVFAAEEARRSQSVVNWSRWWKQNVDSYLHQE